MVERRDSVSNFWYNYNYLEVNYRGGAKRDGNPQDKSQISSKLYIRKKEIVVKLWDYGRY
jgi:hypothetical protein